MRTLVTLVVIITTLFLFSPNSYCAIGVVVEDGNGPVAQGQEAQTSIQESPQDSGEQVAQMPAEERVEEMGTLVDSQVSCVNSDISKFREARANLARRNESVAVHVLERKVASLQSRLRIFKSMKVEIKDLRERMFTLDDKKDIEALKKLVDSWTSKFVDDEEFTKKLQSYVTKEDLEQQLSSYATKTEVNHIGNRARNSYVLSWLAIVGVILPPIYKKVRG
ncbi:MAG: hypothetical protein WC536_03750 [Patescibacteria group bacterium]